MYCESSLHYWSVAPSGRMRFASTSRQCITPQVPVFRSQERKGDTVTVNIALRIWLVRVWVMSRRGINGRAGGGRFAFIVLIFLRNGRVTSRVTHTFSFYSAVRRARIGSRFGAGLEVLMYGICPHLRRTVPGR